MQQAQAAIFFVVLRSLGGAVLFRSSCPSPNSGYRFWLLALTFRSSRPAYGGRLTSPVSTTENQFICPCLFKRHSVSQALCSAWFTVSPGFACWHHAGLCSFWPLALVQQAQAAIFLQALCCLGGAVLFRSSRPSPNHGYPFWLLALTFRSSRPAFCGRLTSPVRRHECDQSAPHPTLRRIMQ